MGIKAHRFLNLETCTLKISSEILSCLLKNNEIPYFELFKTFKSKYPNDVDYEFPLAINFLFLLGKIEYKIEKDMVILQK